MTSENMYRAALDIVERESQAAIERLNQQRDKLLTDIDKRIADLQSKQGKA